MVTPLTGSLLKFLTTFTSKSLFTFCVDPNTFHKIKFNSTQETRKFFLSHMKYDRIVIPETLTTSVNGFTLTEIVHNSTKSFKISINEATLRQNVQEFEMY